MKKYLITITVLLCLFKSYSQVFINGDFENNISNGCDYNNSDFLFNAKVSNVYAFGEANDVGFFGETDIQTAGCYVTPQNGNWCIGLTTATGYGSDAVAIELTSDLVIGQSYEISFYVFSNTLNDAVLTSLKVGVSSNDSTFGNLIYTAIPMVNTWKHILFNFTALQSDKFITVTNTIPNAPPGVGWNQIDNFTINNVTGIPEHTIEMVNIYPNPSNGLITIENRLLTKLKIEFYNILGELINMQSTSNQQTIIDLTNYPIGIYTVKVYSDDEKIVQRRIVIK